MELKYTEKLSHTVLAAIYIAIAFFALKYFGSIIGYIFFSFIVALIAKPLMNSLRKIKIRNKQIPDTILALFSIIFILVVLIGIVAGLVPVFANLVVDISILSESASLTGISEYLANFNYFLSDKFNLAPDFKVEVAAMDELSSILNFNMFGNIIGMVASTIGGIGVGLFSVVFIAFFLIKDDQLFPRLLKAITPDRHQEHIVSTLNDVDRLLSRYFLGLLVEMGSVCLIILLGLWGVAKLDFETALGIGFLAGLLNVIPYVGPLLGGVMGTLMAVVFKFCNDGFAMDVNIWVFFSIVVAVFLVAQLVDNTLLQPIIYSTSVKTHPLEIFIVLLVAGTVGGIVGMLLAIPIYTIVRVFVVNFFPDSKIVKTLIEGGKQ